MKVTVFEKTEPTLKEAQNLVGGYVERIGLKNGDVMLVNEEGLLSNLEVNSEASGLVGMRQFVKSLPQSLHTCL